MGEMRGPSERMNVKNMSEIKELEKLRTKETKNEIYIIIINDGSTWEVPRFSPVEINNCNSFGCESSVRDFAG